MSGAMITWLAGMAGVFAGQRLFAGQDALSTGLTALGVLGVAAGLFLRFQAASSTAEPTAAAAHKKALVWMGVGALSLLVYALSTELVTGGMAEEAAKRTSVGFAALWPIVWLLGAVPAVLVDLAIQDTPQLVQPRRVTQAISNGVIVALGLSLVFPLNYLAQAHNERWDLAYFKTTAAGESTRAIVDNLTDPVVVRLFMPTSSDVTPEMEAYFEPLVGDNLQLEVVDHAAEPLLSEELKVRDNGYVAVTTKDGTEDANTKTWKVGTELDRSKRNLKKLDSEFRKRLLELAKGKRTIYFTVGHGELNWKGGDLPEDKLSGLKKVLQAMNFKVKELGLTEGLGDNLPDDAAVVFILGPTEPFLEGETDALERYIDEGGALFIALEPGGEPLDALLGHVGLARGEGTLASSVAFLRRTYDKADRANVVTNRYSSHESTATLSRYSKQLHLVTPGAAPLEQVDGGRGKVTITARTLPEVWADLDGDLELGEGEEKKIHPLAAVAAGPGDETRSDEFKVVAIGDATAFSDLAVGNKANLQYVLDAVGWLLGEEELSGTVESEEDIKIEHTQEDQKSWFYSTIIGIPFLVMMFGVVRVRNRRKGGQA